mmetsp:Transcript_8975/g.16490  ORF Transcript_8975/g.16490 Transcript_8975/m.16490 type:complete len:315 (-) Transcript_8975:407-1351(-)|eukprot:CAMPEP_0197528170 /NCGR_PEP_ID=MMETSP1318-20131121/24122_1 /TAXON_ID=552666 /ORGANISM="Partenskyella glossopodia, Strain RCC365" /LENGTH=314 /DNA_ID=CAMNT_0043083149 /DNA_START=99 /DNA_END=1046 /DNA_ORIENTATION=+
MKASIERGMNPGGETRPMDMGDGQQERHPNKLMRKDGNPPGMIQDSKNPMKTGSQHGQEIVRKLKPGIRIEVYWPMEKNNFSGTLVREDSPGQWLIRYDDGDLRLHALDNDNWHYRIPILEQQKQEKASGEMWQQQKKPPSEGPAMGGGKGEPVTVENQIPTSSNYTRVPLDHVSKRWGQRFERAKHEAMAEATILQGVIFHLKPSNPSDVESMMALTSQLRDFTEYCNTLPRHTDRGQLPPSSKKKYHKNGMEPGDSMGRGMEKHPRGMPGKISPDMGRKQVPGPPMQPMGDRGMGGMIEGQMGMNVNRRSSP